MANILILFDTGEGQTAKIANHMADAIRDLQHEAAVMNVREPADDLDLHAYDGIIIGASVHAEHHSIPVTQFVKAHLNDLNQRPSFFYSVSLSAAGETERQQADARRLVGEFLEETGWRPYEATTIAGALLYREYNWFIRWIMKKIAAKEGGETDTSRNYEYTDWAQVEEFGRQCVEEA